MSNESRLNVTALAAAAGLTTLALVGLSKRFIVKAKPSSPAESEEDEPESRSGYMSTRPSSVMASPMGSPQRSPTSLSPYALPQSEGDRLFFSILRSYGNRSTSPPTGGTEERSYPDISLTERKKPARKNRSRRRGQKESNL